MYKKIICPFLFFFNPERVHNFIFSILKITHNIPFIPFLIRFVYKFDNKKLERKLFGLTFKNPVGLAAGFDKNAVLYNQLSNFGFGFIEIGTVTPKAQEGNPKKRLFRIKDDNGIINRMGFNNKGVKAIVKELKKNKKKIIIGGNIGKNTNTKPNDYTKDYLECFNCLHPYVDYFVLNVSCPNVSSHAKLEDSKYLKELILEVQKINNNKKIKRPILLKISPDLNNKQLDEIIQLIIDTQIDGVIATNTSIDRKKLKTQIKDLKRIGNGGVSGQPIKDKSTNIIKYLSIKSNKAFPIIGVGGIHSANDAMEKLKAGADLIQIYTGFVYEGPQLIKQINKAILKGF